MVLSNLWLNLLPCIPFHCSLHVLGIRMLQSNWCWDLRRGWSLPDLIAHPTYLLRVHGCFHIDINSNSRQLRFSRTGAEVVEVLKSFSILGLFNVSGFVLEKCSEACDTKQLVLDCVWVSCNLRLSLGSYANKRSKVESMAQMESVDDFV